MIGLWAGHAEGGVCFGGIWEISFKRIFWNAGYIRVML